MRLSMIVLLSLVYLSLMTGCDEASAPEHMTQIQVDTEPMGVGLGVIGGGIVIAAWILAVMSGGDDD